MIKVIGIGPGNLNYVTPMALETIKKADVLVGGERQLQGFAGDGQETYTVKNNLADVVSFIKKRIDEKEVVVLASGDPGMFGILNFLLKHFATEEIEVVPGISSVQLACARLKISWHDALITSVHGREIGNLPQLVRDHEKVIILTDYRHTPVIVARELLRAGTDSRKVWVCQNLSYDNEIIREFNLPDLAKSPDFPGSIMVIIKENGEDY